MECFGVLTIINKEDVGAFNNEDREMFVTMFFGRFDIKNNSMSFCNAGHFPGLLWNSQLNKIERLSTGGTLVAQFEGAAFKKEEKQLCPNCWLSLFTDGLSEAAGRNNRLFGITKTEELFRSGMELSPKDFCRRVKATVDDFRVGCPEESLDDFTILQIMVEK